MVMMNTFINRERELSFLEERALKWTNKPLDRQVLRELERKAQEFDWEKGDRKEVYYIYSRSGFTFTPEEDVKLVNLQELCNQPCN